GRKTMETARRARQKSLVSSSVLALVGALALVPMSARAEAAEGAAVSDSADNAKAIEEIVVPARRREEKLQDVPIAITAVSQDSITRNNIQSVQQLQSFVP